MKSIFTIIKHSGCTCTNPECDGTTVFWESNQGINEWTSSIKEAKEYETYQLAEQAIDDYCAFYTDSHFVRFQIWKMYQP